MATNYNRRRVDTDNEPLIVAELRRAQENLNRLSQDISDKQNIPDSDIEFYISNILPAIPSISTTYADIEGDTFVEYYRPRYGSEDAMFRTRADYERTLRYLKRINAAAESEWEGTDTYAFGGINSQLTSVRAVGDTVQSEFMRRESMLAIRNANKRAIDSLREQGINMVKKPVLQIDFETGEYKQVYDMSRHPVMQYVPETPEQERKYFYTIQKDPSMKVIQPSSPDDGYIIKWGDAVPVEKRDEPVMTQEGIQRSLRKDEKSFDSAELYLRNLQATMDAVLPSGISDMFDEVFDDIYDLSPLDQLNVVSNLMHMGGDDAINAIELWYREVGSSAAAKLNEINRGLKKSIEDAMNVDDYKVFDYENADQWEDELGDSPLNGASSVILEYQRKKQLGETHSVTASDLKRLRG